VVPREGHVVVVVGMVVVGMVVVVIAIYIAIAAIVVVVVVVVVIILSIRSQLLTIFLPPPTHFVAHGWRANDWWPSFFRSAWRKNARILSVGVSTGHSTIIHSPLPA